MVSSICFPLGRFNCRKRSHLLQHLDVPGCGSGGGQSSKAITSPHGSLNSPACSCVSITLPIHPKGALRRPNSSCQVDQIFSKLCAYENDNSPIKKFNEPLAFARVPSHSAGARLLRAFAASASRLSRRLLNERQHCPG